MFSIIGAKAQKNAHLTIYTDVEVWVSLINNNDAKNAQYGWWSVWHDNKTAKRYIVSTEDNEAGYKSFLSNIGDGTYTLVIYLPSSQFDKEYKTDGIALENVVVDNGSIILGDSELYSKELSYSNAIGDFKDWNCLSCPWLYVYNGKEYIKETEIIKDVAGKENETTTSYQLCHKSVVNGYIKVLVKEEKEETTYLDKLVLRVNGVEILPSNTTSSVLNSDDKNYLILEKGESFEVEFKVGAEITKNTEIVIESTGYYNPSQQYLTEIYNRYLRD